MLVNEKVARTAIVRACVFPKDIKDEKPVSLVLVNREIKVGTEAAPFPNKHAYNRCVHVAHLQCATYFRPRETEGLSQSNYILANKQV